MTTVVPGPVAAGPGSTTGHPSAARMLATVYQLADDEFTGRRVGTSGGRAAADWLADCETSAPPCTWTSSPWSGPSRSCTRRRRCAGPTISGPGGWCIGGTSANTSPAPKHLDCAMDVSHCPTTLIREELGLLDDRFSAERVAQLAAAGVHGVLVPSSTDEAGWMPKMIAGPNPVPLPVLAVRTDLHEQMRAMAVGGAGSVAASAPARTVDVSSVNVLGVIRGPGPRRLSVLLTAHFDGVGDDPEVRLPAAADNASGVAVVLEAIRQLQATLDPNVGLAVALLDAEEAGAHGSAHHAPQIPAGTFVINVDGVAELHEAAAVEAGGPAEPLLAALD